ncbi:heterokaryon incompatibility protein-domain-containing protein [Lophiotrema nucula]|uniref:Heterokaryon incompatibility protein-domain-containing protein n=1 Tax=Lophiotrema nucula TaxID=690887 RepID=A0A6A5ZBV2_9PLEO|nr:heterokaryon incompatibility protein-domain-containing protein [Lophiotrema nucula]
MRLERSQEQVKANQGHEIIAASTISREDNPGWQPTNTSTTLLDRHSAQRQSARQTDGRGKDRFNFSDPNPQNKYEEHRLIGKEKSRKVRWTAERKRNSKQAKEWDILSELRIELIGLEDSLGRKVQSDFGVPNESNNNTSTIPVPSSVAIPFRTLVANIEAIETTEVSPDSISPDSILKVKANTASSKFDIISLLGAVEFRPMIPYGIRDYLNIGNAARSCRLDCLRRLPDGQRFRLFAQLPIHTPSSVRDVHQGTEIRLLKVFPAYVGELIFCDMYSTSLEEKPEFKALSYAWGNSKMTHTIHVKNLEIRITANLHQALMQLRSQEDFLILWVDALCINQDDVVERNYQVRQMPKIYSAAQEVVVWLGEGNKQTDEIMEQIALTSDDHRKKKATEMSGLDALFSLPYWKRLWVVQELAAANRTRRTCTLHCGEKSVTLGQFKAFLRKMYRQIKISNLTSIMQPRTLLSLSTPDPSRPFVNVLWHSANLIASDPRDKFYGIRGISPKFYRDNIEVDYMIDFEHLCRKVMALMIKKERRLDVLCYFHRYSVKPAFPSWLLDFSMQNGGITADTYSCDRGRKANAQIVNGILRTKGVCIGSVVRALKYNKTSRTDRYIWSPDTDLGLSSELELIQKVAFSTFQLAEHYPTEADEPKENRFLEMFSVGQQRVMDRLGREYLRRWRLLWQQRIAFEKGKMSSHQWQTHDEEFCAIFPRLIGRSVFTTTAGNLGLGAGDMQEGDRICVLYGCKLPVILRQCGRYFTFVGPAYVDGAMNGEFVTDPAKEDRFWIR